VQHRASGRNGALTAIYLGQANIGSLMKGCGYGLHQRSLIVDVILKDAHYDGLETQPQPIMLVWDEPE